MRYQHIYGPITCGRDLTHPKPTERSSRPAARPARGALPLLPPKTKRNNKEGRTAEPRGPPDPASPHLAPPLARKYAPSPPLHWLQQHYPPRSGDAGRPSLPGGAMRSWGSALSPDYDACIIHTIRLSHAALGKCEEMWLPVHNRGRIEGIQRVHVGAKVDGPAQHTTHVQSLMTRRRPKRNNLNSQHKVTSMDACSNNAPCNFTLYTSKVIENTSACRGPRAARQIYSR